MKSLPIPIPVVVTSWLLTCAAVFFTLNAVFTKPVDVYVETFRTPSLTDAEVVSRAYQSAYGKEERWWWINNSTIRLVLATDRRYELDESVQHYKNVEWKHWNPENKRVNVGG